MANPIKIKTTFIFDLSRTNWEGILKLIYVPCLMDGWKTFSSWCNEFILEDSFHAKYFTSGKLDRDGSCSLNHHPHFLCILTLPPPHAVFL